MTSPNNHSIATTTNFFRILCGTIKKNLNFSYANMKWFVWQLENTKNPYFTMGKLE
jgi:hypothetical protein